MTETTRNDASNVTPAVLRAWTRPAVRRLAAGSAEDAAEGTLDAQNPS